MRRGRRAMAETEASMPGLDLPLDPLLKADVEARRRGPAWPDMTVAEARARFREGRESRATPAVASVEDRSIAGPAGPLPVRIYRARMEPGLPLVVYFHGGGFILGGLETHDGNARRLADALGALVVSVEYR